MSSFFEKIKGSALKHYTNYIAVSAALLIFTVLTLTDSLPQSTLFLLEKIGISIILSVSLGLVVGFLGELSLGHAGFMCIGAYLGGKTAELLSDVGIEGILSLLISVVVGALCAAALGFVVGLPALRLKGDYLAIVTLAFCEIVKTIFENSSKESFGGPMGLRTPRFDKHYLFIVIFAFILICLAVMQNIIRSKHGRAITAIRDNEIAKNGDYITYTVRKTSAGQRYVVVHNGFDVLAAIMPMQIVTQEYLADLSEFQALCTEQYYREKDRADAAAALADAEEQEAEQIGMEDVQE